MKIYCKEKGIPVPEKKNYEERFREAKADREETDKEVKDTPETGEGPGPEQAYDKPAGQVMIRSGNGSDWNSRNNAPQNQMPGQQIDFTIDDSLIPSRDPSEPAEPTDNAGVQENDTDSADGV